MQALRRRWVLQAAAVLAGAVAGAALMAIGERGDAVDLAGFVLLGLAALAGAALVFYEVGRSEDRERAGEGPPVTRPGPRPPRP